jgi:hypothetical protein
MLCRRAFHVQRPQRDKRLSAFPILQAYSPVFKHCKMHLFLFTFLLPFFDIFCTISCMDPTAAVRKTPEAFAISGRIPFFFAF